MKSFLLKFFAFVGVALSVLIVLSVWASIALLQEPRAPQEPESLILTLNFDEPVVERSESSPLDFAMHEEVTPLLDVLRAIDLAKKDPHVKGIRANFGGTQPELVDGQEIRAALTRFHESGKPTFAFGPSIGDFGGSNRAYYLASAFDSIWLQPAGELGLAGIAVQLPFAKSGLAKFGVSADFAQREEFKSAFDFATQDDFTPPVRAMEQGMIDDLAQQIADGIAESRKFTPDHVKELMAAGPYTDEEALKAGLVTHIGYLDELDEEIDKTAGKDTPRISVEDYLSYDHHGNGGAENQGRAYLWRRYDCRQGGRPHRHSGRNRARCRPAFEAFDQAAESKDVKAILFRVNSPGGAPAASETIRHALVHAQKEGKPVIVSMGTMAASGGYWISMNADRIVAEPGTLTGSIGVLGGKFVIGGAMKELGINWGTLKTTDNAAMWSMIDGFTPPQRARLDALMDRTYALFRQNVSEARKIPMDKMPDISKGHVWTGQQAVKLGLVDELGGYTTAVDAVRTRLKLAKDAPVELEVYPPPETPAERVVKLLKNFTTESVLLQPAILQLQKFAAFFGPFLHAAAVGNGSVQLLAPESAPK